MLEIKDLSVGYGGVMAISQINCHVHDAEIVTLVGANGAGKSTLLRAISGALAPKSGSIILDNKKITDLAPHRIVSLGISHSPEGRKVFATLTVKENLIMGAYTQKKIVKSDFDLIYSIFPILNERCDQLAGTLSGGEQQMLAIGRALMAKPRVLLLDEPSLGLSPAITKELFRLIEKINQSQKISILLVEQNATSALKLSHRGYVLEAGHVVLEGKSTTLLNSPLVKAAYLGK